MPLVRLFVRFLLVAVLAGGPLGIAVARDAAGVAQLPLGPMSQTMAEEECEKWVFEEEAGRKEGDDRVEYVDAHPTAPEAHAAPCPTPPPEA